MERKEFAGEWHSDHDGESHHKRQPALRISGGQAGEKQISDQLAIAAVSVVVLSIVLIIVLVVLAVILAVSVVVLVIILVIILVAAIILLAVLLEIHRCTSSLVVMRIV